MYRVMYLCMFLRPSSLPHFIGVPGVLYYKYGTVPGGRLTPEACWSLFGLGVRPTPPGGSASKFVIVKLNYSRNNMNDGNETLRSLPLSSVQPCRWWQRDDNLMFSKVLIFDIATAASTVAHTYIYFAVFFKADVKATTYYSWSCCLAEQRTNWRIE